MRRNVSTRITTILIHPGLYSVRSDIAMSKGNETTESSHASAQAANDNQLIRVKRTFRFLRFTNDLDTAIHCALSSILEMPLTEDENMLTQEDVEDIIQSLPSMSLITPGFFYRIPLPFRLLRCVMSIHNVDRVPADLLGSFRLREEEKSNSRLQEILWIFLHSLDLM